MQPKIPLFGQKEIILTLLNRLNRPKTKKSEFSTEFKTMFLLGKLLLGSKYSRVTGFLGLTKLILIRYDQNTRSELMTFAIPVHIRLNVKRQCYFQKFLLRQQNRCVLSEQI